jgi:hypothetical protein
MDVGGELRAARRARKLSIDDIARATKIAPVVLRAIEDNAFDHVPPGVFARGFLRAYAREVGLDAESLVRRYRAEWEPPSVAAGATVASEPTPNADGSHGSSSAQILQVEVIIVITTCEPNRSTCAGSPPTARADPASTTYDVANSSHPIFRFSDVPKMHPQPLDVFTLTFPVPPVALND